ncbi:SnoaL-like protein [Mumia flava]|uniref:SnoaL-like protein n=1 Tax=Mumia flava TaxID=1348852 RepID=A0A2M9B6P1_9ACTN|nr:nuclear transport factor 2 family protein [Mumia flava]PJJ53592.1 SnoaL-like protein [Mumia flava]
MTPQPGPAEGPSLREKVERHCDLFNACVQSGDFGPFVATFAEDAAMDIENNPYGPFGGREQIAAAYTAQPPTDAMLIDDVEELAADRARVTFTWSSGSRGSMVVVWDDELVGEVHLRMVVPSTATE